MDSAIGLLYRAILVGAPILFVAALITQPGIAAGNRFPRMQRGVAIAAVVAAVIPGLWLLASRSLSSDNGWVILVDLSAPIALALLAVSARSSIRTLCTAGAALLLAVCCFLGGFSIGPFYTPAAALLIVAGAIGLIPPASRQAVGGVLGHVP